MLSVSAPGWNLAAPPSAAASPPVRTEKYPVGVTFHRDTIFRTDGRGDNWCITWAPDDSQVTSLDNGNWLVKGDGYHHRLYRIRGGPDEFQREELRTYPRFFGATGSWFGYEIVSVGETIYSVISKTPLDRWSGPFRGIKLLKSPDNGNTWYRVDRWGNERPLGPDDPARNEVDEKAMFFLDEFGITDSLDPLRTHRQRPVGSPGDSCG